MLGHRVTVKIDEPPRQTGELADAVAIQLGRVDLSFKAQCRFVDARANERHASFMELMRREKSA